MLVDPTLILAAGMPRSGSTWLYNAVRLLIASSPEMMEQFSCGWIGDWKSLPKKKFMLIKMHGYEKSLIKESSCILYSYRDIRDALASAFRKSGQIPSVEIADYLVEEYEKWATTADYLMRYESMLHGKQDIIRHLMSMLNLEDVEPARIVSDIEKLSYNSEGPKNEIYHMINLYHHGHITDGRHGSWKDLVDADLVKQIEVKHKGWFEAHEYSLGD